MDDELWLRLQIDSVSELERDVSFLNGHADPTVTPYTSDAKLLVDRQAQAELLAQARHNLWQRWLTYCQIKTSNTLAFKSFCS